MHLLDARMNPTGGMVSEKPDELLTLLRAHCAGDHDATGRISAVYQQDLWGFLVNHLPNRADAEDLFQDVNLKILTHADQVRDGSRFRSWVFSIAHNAVRSHFRKKKPVQGDEGFEQRIPADGVGNPHLHLVRGERAAQLRQALTRLPQRDREILLLDTMAEMPQQEIADQFELNLNTVKTILRRARIKLARYMTEAAHE